jgi:hypothetical protein
VLNPGDLLQRYGDGQGRFLSDPGAKPGDVSLFPEHGAYDGDPPTIWTPNSPTEVTAGPAAGVEWPGGTITPGGATQYMTTKPIANGFTQLSLDDLYGMDTSGMSYEQYVAWENAVNALKGGGG